MAEPIRAILSPLIGLARPAESANEADAPFPAKPRVVLVIDQAPQHLLSGLDEIAINAPRDGTIEVAVGRDSAIVGAAAHSDWIWFVSFELVYDFPLGHLEIVPSHDDFTEASDPSSAPQGAFRVLVRYGRKCEAFRGLGHILAITRSVFSSPSNTAAAAGVAAAERSASQSAAHSQPPSDPSPPPLKHEDSTTSSTALSLSSLSSEAPVSERATKALANDVTNPVPSVAFGSPLVKDGKELAALTEEGQDTDLDLDDVKQDEVEEDGEVEMKAIEAERDLPARRKSKSGQGGVVGNGIGRAGTEGMNGRVGEALKRQETCLFETLGIMIDCSRNGVLKLSAVKDMLRSLSMMGCNMCQLYTEDTYQIAGETFFGYFRGPYTQKELKEIDDYADALGIEIIPCIQTLGHLGQMLQWPRYAHLRDTHEVLLSGSPEVYTFIEKMISSVTAPLRTKRIHIGMDEAHGVGEGRFRQIFGYKEGTQVFTDHLRKVNEICKRVGVKPMIWSDMLFCLHAKNNSLQGYYDSANPATPELVNAIPSEIELVYWDYYHTMAEPYANKIAQHWELARKPPWMASGIWTWSRFWTALPFTFETVRASMRASKLQESGVRHAMTTIWGDEGNECDVFSGLPGILYFCEHAYTKADEVDVVLLKRKFDGICGANFDDFVFASKLDDTQPENQPVDNRAHFTPNMSKWLLWEDPFYSFMAPQYDGYDLETHFGRIAAYLDTALIPADASPADIASMTATNPFAYLPTRSLGDFPFNRRLRMPFLIGEALALKCHLRERLVYAYRSGDKGEIDRLAGPSPDSRLSKLRDIVNDLWRYHRGLWMSTYKPFGWDVLDLRYGGLIARLNTMHERIVAYLDESDPSVTNIDELEVQTEVVYPGSGPNLMLDHHRVSRPQYC